MPYDKTNDLPSSVRDNLPKHAEKIYIAAFNSAIEQYDDEQTAHKVAWSAVKKDYIKDDHGRWIKKGGGRDGN